VRLLVLGFVVCSATCDEGVMLGANLLDNLGALLLE
jgi:hypothetical protein